MKKIIIITSSFYDCVNFKVKIGGLETYIKDLSLLCLKLKFETVIIQYSRDSKYSREYEYNGVTIVDQPLNFTPQKLYDKVRSDNPAAYIIIASDQFNIKDNNEKTLQIQHGIAFDIPQEYITGLWSKSTFLIHLNKLLRCIKNVRRFYQVPNTICVDYNYYNWLRTIGIVSNKYKIKVIPNYASQYIERGKLNQKLLNHKKVTNIIFARRFVDYRGTLLFADVAEKLLERYPSLNITFAGSGPLKGNLQTRFGNHPRVTITAFSSDESVEVHFHYDVAVVPTIFSEGTSLSLLEAMAAGCLSIATHVGGMTNIIIDGYNGIMSYPDSSSLYNSIIQAIEMSKEDFISIVENGYCTVTKGFSIEHWRSEWTEVLREWTK